MCVKFWVLFVNLDVIRGQYVPTKQANIPRAHGTESALIHILRLCVPGHSWHPGAARVLRLDVSVATDSANFPLQ